jgi:hypothetical protein
MGGKNGALKRNGYTPPRMVISKKTTTKLVLFPLWKIKILVLSDEISYNNGATTTRNKLNKNGLATRDFLFLKNDPLYDSDLI